MEDIRHVLYTSGYAKLACIRTERGIIILWRSQELIMVKMIVMDLDGTLLDENKNISSYTLLILEKCKNHGIILALTTARSKNACNRIIELVTPDVLILNDGALIEHNNENIYKKLLSAETTFGILNEFYLNKLNIKNISVETEFNFYRSYTEFFHQDWDYGVYYDFLQPLSQESYKISAEIPNKEMAIDINNKFKESKLVYNNGEKWYRYIHKDVGKMSGIEVVSKRLDVQISEVLAFGDDYNDIDMIKNCGIGVAMENSLKETKECANYVCKGNNEDGVARWIEKNIL